MSQGMEYGHILEQLRHFRAVCQKIKSSLVAGREEVVSPTAVCRSFMEAFENEKAGESGSTDSGIFPGELPSADSPGAASRSSNRSNMPDCPFIEPAEGWTIEYFDKDCEVCGHNSLCVCSRRPSGQGLRPLAEAAYREFFYQKEHKNYIADEPDVGPLVLSIKQEGEALTSVRILLRSSDHYLHGMLSLSGDCKNVSLDDTVRALAKEMGLITHFKLAQFPDIEKELLRIDETFVKNHHKVGVIRVREGQRTEEEIFSNVHGPGPYDAFLNLLGTRTKLKGFKRFLGGLDSDRDLTGETTVFTEHMGLELMFHVATLLPFTPNDTQQINKKRHIGNDIVCLVFLDTSRTTFNPSWVRSNFIHCYVVVQLVIGAHGQPLYKVGVTRRSTVPSFSPELRNLGVFAHSTTLQQFLLTKMVNGERASYHAPKFLKLTNRSRGQLLQEFADTFTEYMMAGKQRRATRKINKRSNWLPIGASRPPSPLMDSVREKYMNHDKLADDFSVSLQGPDLADVMFLVGDRKVPLYGVKAILACRSRAFRMMFKESKPAASGGARLTSPLVRRRMPHTSSTVYSPQTTRKNSGRGLGKMKKKSSVPEGLCPQSPPPTGDCGRGFSFGEDPKSVQISEHYVITGFTEHVFGEVLSYSMTGSCTIKPENVVGLACASERFELEELKQACLRQLPQCLVVPTVCGILTELEKYLSYSAAKAMIITCLEYVDTHAEEILASADVVQLSENMVHLILRRDTDVPELLKVKAAFAWGHAHLKDGGPDFKALVTPLVKHVRIHLIDPQDIMKTLVPSEIFDMDKVMAALAYQVDPESVEEGNYTMFRPRKKSSVLSSR